MKLEQLIKSALMLGVETGIVMPIDEIRLGHQLSEQPRSSALPELLKLAEAANMHSRRVALSALRRMKAWDEPRVLDLFIRALRDPEGWVRYDAAWALGESGTQNESAMAGLDHLAQGATKNPALSDGNARAAAKAAESLSKLRAM